MSEDFPLVYSILSLFLSYLLFVWCQQGVWRFISMYKGKFPAPKSLWSILTTYRPRRREQELAKEEWLAGEISVDITGIRQPKAQKQLSHPPFTSPTHHCISLLNNWKDRAITAGFSRKHLQDKAQDPEGFTEHVNTPHQKAPNQMREKLQSHFHIHRNYTPFCQWSSCQD